MKADLEYRVDEMFTRFYPNTPAGEDAWNVMADKDGVAAVLNHEAKRVIAQLRSAGYSVAKAQKSTQSADDIFAELEG